MGSKHRIARAQRAWERRIERAQWAVDFVEGWEEISRSDAIKNEHDLLSKFGSMAVNNWKNNYRTVYEVDPDLLTEILDSELPDQNIPASVFRHLPHNIPLFVFPEPVRIIHEDLVAMYGQFMVVPHVWLEWQKWSDDPDNDEHLKSLLAKHKVSSIEELPIGADSELLPRLLKITDSENADYVRFLWFGHNEDDVTDQIITTQTIDLLDNDLVDLRVEINRVVEKLETAIADLEVDLIERDKNWEEIARQQFAIASALTLYVCSEEPDIIDVEPPVELELSRKSKTSYPTVKNLGLRIGSALRKYRADATSSSATSTGKTVLPHLRKAHWHRFWTGPRDGDRKLIVKWLPPTPVNADKGEIIATVRPVKANK